MAGETIRDDDILYRRLSKEQVHPEDNTRAVSNAYNRDGKPDQSISAELASSKPPSLEEMRAFAPRNRPTGFGVGILIAGEVRESGFDVVPAPDEPGSASPAHCLIKPKEGQQNTKQKCRELAKITEVTIPPGTI